MSKYIIDLRPDCKVVQQICASDGNVNVGARSVGLLDALTDDYVKENFKHLLDAEYQRGLEDGKAQPERGCEGCRFEGTRCIACENCCNSHMNHWTAKQTDDEIKVGDEVKPFYTDITGVVTLIDGDTIYVLWRDGSSTSVIKLKEVRKTGRHFDIASILEDMRHD